MHHGKMPLVVERPEGCKRGMQAEETVQVEYLVCRDCDAGAHGVVIRLPVGNHNVQAISRAALEDDHQPPARVDCGFRHHGTNQEAGDGRSAGNCQGAVAKEESSVGLHVYLFDRLRTRYRR